LWTVYKERAHTKKALRCLKEQEWSIDFLVALLNKAAVFKRSGVTVMLQKGDVQMVINADTLVPAEMTRKEADIDLQAKGVSLDAILNAAWDEGLMR
jgi:hypothetical protein